MGVYYKAHKHNNTQHNLSLVKADLDRMIKEFNTLSYHRDDLRRRLSLKPIKVEEEAIMCLKPLKDYKQSEGTGLVEILDKEFNKIDKKHGFNSPSATHPIANKVLLEWYNNRKDLPVLIKCHILTTTLNGFNKQTRLSINEMDEAYIKTIIMEVEEKYKFTYWDDLMPKLEEIMGKEKSDALKIKLYNDPGLHELKRPYRIEEGMDVEEEEAEDEEDEEEDENLKISYT